MGLRTIQTKILGGIDRKVLFAQLRLSSSQSGVAQQLWDLDCVAKK